MRNRGWQGRPPTDDAEARERIIAAAMRCIDRHGPNKTGLSDVATELGVTRQTVYRHFASTDDLFQAVSITAADSFVDRMVAHVAELADPADVLVECLVFTIERLHNERYLSLLLARVRDSLLDAQFTSEIPASLTQELLRRLPVDWESLGLDDMTQSQIIEIYLRTLQSFVFDPGPNRSTDELRQLLSNWISPAIRQYLVTDAPATRRHDKPAMQTSGSH